MRATIVSTLAMASTVSAHALMYGVWVNGEDQGDGQKKTIRTPPSNSPVKDLTTSDIVCNVNGATAGTDFVKAAAGDEISFEWYHDNRNDDIIDASHQGPIITWIAEYTEDDGTGAIWSKIAEDGYDGSTWAVQKLIDAGGKTDFTIPTALKAGKYLIRQEIIALHEGDTMYSEDANRGAQFYPSCVQFEITGSGSSVPDQGFDFNTDYTYSDPGIHFNLYGSYSSYEIPGPAVWSGSGSGSGSGSSSSSSATQPAATQPAATQPAATQPAATTPAVIETPVAETTLATVIKSTDAAAPIATSTPPSTCNKRRRRRSMKKNAKKAL